MDEEKKAEISNKLQPCRTVIEQNLNNKIPSKEFLDKALQDFNEAVNLLKREE